MHRHGLTDRDLRDVFLILLFFAVLAMLPGA
jgi:hypothetical protein